MEWNKLKKMAALGLAGMMLVGAVMTTSAAPEDNPAETDADVTFKAGTIIDPPPGPDEPDEKPEPPLVPGGDDSLAVYAPNLDFGEVEISSTDALYPAKAQGIKHQTTGVTRYVPNYMSVEDVRGTNTGWNVMVQIKTPFTTTKAGAVNPTLSGVFINFNNSLVESQTDGVDETGIIGITPTVKLDMSSGGAAVKIFSASAGKGQGKYVHYFGTSKDDSGLTTKNGTSYNPGIELDIPEGTGMDAASYKAKLDWTISDTP